MTFPLQLTSFEEYMLHDERPAYPMNFFAGLRFAGDIQADALVTAVHHARKRHPLLAGRVQRSGRKLYWRPAEENYPQVLWTKGPLDKGFRHAEPIDLFREPGLRVHAAVGGGSTHVDLQFHHSACDGVGAFRFINDLLVSYAAAVRGDVHTARLHRLEPSHLASRGRFGLTAGKLLGIIPKQMVGLLGVRQFLMRKPVSLAEDKSVPGTLSGDYPGVVTGSLGKPHTDRLWEAAAEQNVTANDLLLRDLFQALSEWRAENQQQENGDWLRMAVPMNLRTAADRRLPAANVTTMVFLDRQPEQIAQADSLLASVHEEMQLIKRLRLGLTFNFSLSAARALPGGLARHTRGDRCMSTAVLTNIGEPLAKTPLPREHEQLVVGNVILTGMELAAPIRPHTAAAFAIWKYAGRLHVTLHYDVQRLSTQQAHSLLAQYLKQIRTTAQHGAAMATAT